MPLHSVFPDLDIPKTDLLSYVFGGGCLSRDPIWLDSEDPSRFLSLHSLQVWVRRFAAVLGKYQLHVGDVVIVFTPNHLFLPVAYFGVIGYGAIFTGANPAYTVGELTHMLRDTETKLILVHPSVVDTALEAARNVGLPSDRLLLFSDRPVEPTKGVFDWHSFLPLVSTNMWQWERLDHRTSTTRPASLNYSSGTTGLPKGVVVSHHALIANCEQIIFMRDQGKPYTADNRPTERWVGFLPFYHAYGQVYSILMAAKLRARVFIMSAFNYEQFLKVIQDYKVSHLQIAPPIMIMLSKRPETAKYDLSSVTDVLCGAAPLSMSLQNEVIRKFGFQVKQGWGMTEVTCGGLNMPGDITSQTGSVGMLHPSSSCQLVDDEGREVGPGQRGELLYKGPNVALGYWKHPVATSETFTSDGWLRTGDIAMVDHKGLFWIVDRKKAMRPTPTPTELIKVSGLQVAPAELEAVLLQHEQIADAAVVGIDIGEDEYPRAYIVLNEEISSKRQSEKSIQFWVEARVAKHKRLQGGVVFVNEIPKLASGKIQRKVIREWARKDARALQPRIRQKL